ncbi:MAG: LysM domain-containing protein [bacterium]|nr:LysM domain-containing protein [bacterium]
MKKFILAAIFAVFGFLTLTNNTVYALPDGGGDPDEGMVQTQSGGFYVTPFEYKVRKGDKLEHLAKRFQTTVDAILKANPAVKDRNLILKDSTLTVLNLVPMEEVVNVFEAYEKNVVEPLRAEKQMLRKDRYLAFVLLAVLMGVCVALLLLITKLLRGRDQAEIELKLRSNTIEAQTNIITDLGTRLEVKRQQLNALTETNQALTSLTRTMPGASYNFESRDHGTLKDVYVVAEIGLDEDGKTGIKLLKCVYKKDGEEKSSCGVQVRPQNAGSHFGLHDKNVIELAEDLLNQIKPS